MREVPKAIATPQAGRAPSADDIIAHRRERLAHFKCPKAMDLIELPKTSTGKVQEFALRERQWAGRDQRIH